LESIPHQLSFVVLDDEIEGGAEVGLQFAHFGWVSTHELEGHRSRLEKNVNVVRALLVFVLRSVVDKFG